MASRLGHVHFSSILPDRTKFARRAIFFVDLTFFIENQSFFDNSFVLYPVGEKTEVADSEKRTPEAKFRPFFSSILVFPESHKNQ